MTASFGTIGSIGQGTATASADMPASVAAGDMLVAVVGYGEASNTIPTCTATNFPFQYIGAMAGGSVAGFGVDTGARGLAVFWRIADGTEQDADTVDFSIGGSSTNRLIVAAIVRVTKTSSYWQTPVLMIGEDTSLNTTVSVTPTATAQAANGDFLIGAHGLSPDNFAISGSGTITWTGSGTATLTARNTVASTQGGDMRYSVGTRGVTGTSSGDPTVAWTMGGNVIGVAAIVLVRDTNTPPGRIMGPKRLGFKAPIRPRMRGW